MKGTILSINRHAVVVDVTHAVSPQDVLHGAYVLSTCWDAFPPSSIQIAIVDPGLGTERKGIGASYGGH